MIRQCFFVVICLLSINMSACSVTQETTENKETKITVDHSEKKTQQIIKKTNTSDQITSADFKRAVQTAVRNMIRSGILDNPNKERYVVVISHIMDTTKKNFDTADIKQKLSADLAASRKVRVISANAKNVSAQINISGRITQRTAYVRGGKKRQEIYLHLVLTEAKSGIMLWENVTPVVKKIN